MEKGLRAQEARILPKRRARHLQTTCAQTQPLRICLFRGLSGGIANEGAEDPQRGRTGGFQDGIQDEAGGEAITTRRRHATPNSPYEKHKTTDLFFRGLSVGVESWRAHRTLNRSPDEDQEVAHACHLSNT